MSKCANKKCGKETGGAVYCSPYCRGVVYEKRHVVERRLRNNAHYAQKKLARRDPNKSFVVLRLEYDPSQEFERGVLFPKFHVSQDLSLTSGKDWKIWVDGSKFEGNDGKKYVVEFGRLIVQG